jgi:hypothetical protein
MDTIEIVQWHKQKIIKKLQDEIFNEEEWLWKESRSLAEQDAKQDKGYLTGLKNALKIVEEYNPNKWSINE